MNTDIKIEINADIDIIRARDNNYHSSKASLSSASTSIKRIESNETQGERQSQRQSLHSLPLHCTVEEENCSSENENYKNANDDTDSDSDGESDGTAINVNYDHGVLNNRIRIRITSERSLESMGDDECGATISSPKNSKSFKTRKSPNSLRSATSSSCNQDDVRQQKMISPIRRPPHFCFSSSSIDQSNKSKPTRKASLSLAQLDSQKVR